MKKIMIQESSENSLIRRRLLRMLRKLNVIIIKMNTMHNNDMDITTFTFEDKYGSS